MKKSSMFVSLMVAAMAVAATAPAQVRELSPVTEEMLLYPSPNDWLMYSRTYDAQRFSPLDQINTGNAGSLVEAWSRPLDLGTIESIPLVHDGVMYALVPRSSDQGLRTSMAASRGPSVLQVKVVVSQPSAPLPPWDSRSRGKIGAASGASRTEKWSTAMSEPPPAPAASYGAWGQQIPVWQSMLFPQSASESQSLVQRATPEPPWKQVSAQTAS